MISALFVDTPEPSHTTGNRVCANGYRAPKQAGKAPSNGLAERFTRPDTSFGSRVVRGFTLIELLLGIAVIVALSALAVPSYRSYVDDVRLTVVIEEMGEISLYLARFRIENGGALPDTLAQTPAGTLTDPWGNAYRYLNIEDAAGPGLGKLRKDKNLVPLNTDFDLYSMGKDGKSKSPLTAAHSRDDIIRANNGGYVGPASEY
jgi:general secretion pathway protein G